MPMLRIDRGLTRTERGITRKNQFSVFGVSSAFSAVSAGADRLPTVLPVAWFKSNDGSTVISRTFGLIFVLTNIF